MTAGITFQESMHGGFALGAQTPAEGAAAGTRLGLHTSVDIDDLARFVADPQHPGALSGTVDFQPIGLGIPAPTGVFQLFSPGPGTEDRRMVYELAFEADGKPYYLAGEKRVHNDPGLDLWSDTTTLYTRLHAGHDRDGPVAGAGILKLGVPQLLALLASLRPTGDGDPATVVAFGRFFFGELWDLYAPHVTLLGGR